MSVSSRIISSEKEISLFFLSRVICLYGYAIFLSKTHNIKIGFRLFGSNDHHPRKKAIFDNLFSFTYPWNVHIFAFASILFHVVQNWLNFIELWLWTTAKCFSSLLHSNEIDYKRKTQINEAQWNAHVHAHYRNSKSSNKRICRVFYASYTLRTRTSYRHTKISLCSL